MGGDVVAAADLLAQVAPEALDHGRRAGLPYLAAIGGAHAGREVHPQQQRQRQVVRGGVRGAAYGGRLRADGERLHRQAGDPADQQAGDAVVLHQVVVECSRSRLARPRRRRARTTPNATPVGELVIQP